MQSAIEQIQGMINDFQATVNEKQAAIERSKNVLTDASWIVVVVDGGLMALNPEVVNGRVPQGGVKVGPAHTVRRFSKENAEIVASDAANGNGVKAQAMFWVDATKRQIEDTMKSIAFLQERIEELKEIGLE